MNECVGGGNMDHSDDVMLQVIAEIITIFRIMPNLIQIIKKFTSLSLKPDGDYFF